ncbi:MAG: nucleoside deaminase [Rikenellaceae bacterium]
MENEQNIDEKYMRLALEEALVALDEGEVPIGAIIVSRGRVVGRGHNLVERLRDVTAHAEMQAITAAAESIGGKYLTDCTMYVTLEPCPMCAAALGWAQLPRLVFGAADPKRGYRCHSDRLLHPKSIVKEGVLKEQCEELLSTFFRKLR